MKAKININKVQRRFAGSCIALAVVVALLSIYLFMRWCSGGAALLGICAFLAFGACALLPAFGSIGLLQSAGWDDPDDPFRAALAEVVMVAFLALPFWGYHERTGGETPFWSWIMLSVSVGVPLVIFVLAYFFTVKANKKDRQIDADKKAAERAKLDELLQRWRGLALGEAVEPFKESVKEFRRTLNMHFANECCMKMIAESSIRWSIVDDYINDEDLNKLDNEPQPSFAMLRTTFVAGGDRVDAWLKLFHTGCAVLGWNGAKHGEKVSSWQDLIPAIEKKLGE